MNFYQCFLILLFQTHNSLELVSSVNLFSGIQMEVQIISSAKILDTFLFENFGLTLAIKNRNDEYCGNQQSLNFSRYVKHFDRPSIRKCVMKMYFEFSNDYLFATNVIYYRSKLQTFIRRKKKHFKTFPVLCAMHLMLLYSLSNIMKFTCVSVFLPVCVSVFVRKRLPNHAHYGDETFRGDSMGLG